MKALAGIGVLLLAAVGCAGPIASTATPLPLTATSLPVAASTLVGTPTPIVIQIRPGNVTLQIVPTPTPTPTPLPTSTPTPIPTSSPAPSTSTPAPPSPPPSPVFAIGTIDLDIVLPVAPNGLAGYDIDIIIGPEVVLRDAVSVFSLFRVNGNRISAVDLLDTVQPGAVDITLVTITLEAQQVGETFVEIGIQQIDDDNGDPINVSFAPGIIQVVP